MNPVASCWALLLTVALAVEIAPVSPPPSEAASPLCPFGVVHTYLVDNTLLKSDNPNGVNYRNTKNLLDRAPEDAQWWTIVQGIDSGDGWVSDVAKGKYLPMTVDGEPVLLCNPSAEQLAAAEKLKIAAAAAEQQKTMWLAIIILGILPISVLCMCRLFHGTTCCGVGGDESYSPVDEEELDTQ
eukprot:gnl/TRDRNA2_/TRDRNA2_166254_c0_seq3.p1 gnl/TRDRNA2_/TRDRNA2_166254_c0~~gnl/TRDRNA2_/TRDRNA2_166254_c0_seq3.p1  ORF type:complete len:184 (-),score=29.85 gnl/TRDRNA2_/TRDRNA2_166254_c0_seq3:703-1254(-)